MLNYYKGHCIIVLVDDILSAEITECATSFPLPTKVTATWEEGERALLTRAQSLVDLYLATKAGIATPINAAAA